MAPFLQKNSGVAQNNPLCVILWRKLCAGDKIFAGFVKIRTLTPPPCNEVAAFCGKGWVGARFRFSPHPSPYGDTFSSRRRLLRSFLTYCRLSHRQNRQFLPIRRSRYRNYSSFINVSDFKIHYSFKPQMGEARRRTAGYGGPVDNPPVTPGEVFGVHFYFFAGKQKIISASETLRQRITAERKNSRRSLIFA